MKPEIKERITQIQNGIVPEGYKYTPAGIIPNEWNYEQLGKLCIGKGKYGLNAPACDFREDLPQYIRITDIDDNGKYNHDNSMCVNSKESPNYYLEENDILFARTGGTVGKSYLYDKNDGKLVYAGFLIKFSINAELIHPAILKSQLNNNRYWHWVSVISTRSGQPGINSEEYAKYNLIVPPKPEQKRIADVLEKWNTEIELCEKEIAKLENLKIGFKNSLLFQKGKNSPPIRLSGYSEPWEQYKISDLFKITRGNVLATNLTKEEMSEEYQYPVYSSQTKNNGLMGYYNEYLYENAITWTTDGANAGTVNYRDGKFYCTNVCGVLLADKVIPNRMIAEAINIIAKYYVSYVGNPKLMNSTMSEISVFLPKQECERLAISSIFNNLDKLIELQERKLEALRKQQKSMQQLLLTGIVRV